MILGRRGRSADPIVAFWAWWATARARAERAVIADDWHESGLVDELNARVTAIAPELVWEFASGAPRSQHLLVVSGAGDPALRSTAERWLRAAPDPDDVFSYAAARQASLDALEHQLRFDDQAIALGELRFAAEVDDDAAQVDVTVWHPGFAGVPADGRFQVAFLALNWLLGEDGVEIWVRAIAPTTAAGPALTGGELLTVVQRLEPHWSMCTGERDGRPLVATVQVPLSPARWPAADIHVRLDVPFRTANPGGLPVGGSLAALHDFEDRLLAYADGPVLVAQEACAGVRTYHLYADREAGVAGLAPIVDSWPEGRARTTVTHDPAWQGVKHLRL